MTKRKQSKTVSAVVTPAMFEEIGRIAAANSATVSQTIMNLLEEKLTERANERLADVLDGLERRLKKMEDRSAALLVKVLKYSAQASFFAIKSVALECERLAIEELSATEIMTKEEVRKAKELKLNKELSSLLQEGQRYAANVAESRTPPAAEEEVQ